MNLHLFLSIVAFSTSIHGLAFQTPRATSAAETEERLQHSGGWTPRPTAAPKLRHELLRRQDADPIVFVAPDRTCGYISGLPRAEFHCPATDSCVLFPTTGTGWGSIGCCDSESCGSRLACVDFDQYHTSSICDFECDQDTAIQKCTDAAAPYCNTIRFPREGVQDFFCDSMSISTAQLASTTYDGETGRTVSTMTMSDSMPLSLPSSPSSTLAASTSDTTGYSDSTTTIISSGSRLDSARYPTSIIVGGVVGGAVAITLLSLALFFFFRKNRNLVPRKSSETRSRRPPSYTIYGGQQELGIIGLAGAINHPESKIQKSHTSNG